MLRLTYSAYAQSFVTFRVPGFDKIPSRKPKGRRETEIVLTAASFVSLGTLPSFKSMLNCIASNTVSLGCSRSSCIM